MKTVLYLIRHGKTKGKDLCYKGQTDVPLSEEGIRQAESLGDHLKKEGISFSCMYTSDLSRAVQTAYIIGRFLNCNNIKKEKLLRERNFGIWEGKTLDEIKERWKEDFERWKKDPLNFYPPEGESTLELKERVEKVLKEIKEKHRGETVCIVAHGGVNRVIICSFLGLSLKNIFSIEQDYCCLNKIEIYDDGFSVIKKLNWTLRITEDAW